MDASKKEEKQNGFLCSFVEYFEMFVWCFFAVLTLFTFAFRLCEVEGASMENTFHNGEPLLLCDVGYTPRQGDVIVFQLKDYKEDGERLVKRVIATGGQTVRIDTNTNEITVDGVAYADPHATLKKWGTETITNEYEEWLFHYGLDKETGIFETTVPEHTVFAMGDNRNNSNDSRNPSIGFIDERCILGKAILRLSPFTWLAGEGS